MSDRAARPICLIIAGPNGAGKTTFATEFLPREAGILHFVNADLIAAGLSPLRPAKAVLTAGRVFLSELDRLATARVNFAFESTLSGLTYVERIRRWKRIGYRVELVYLRLDTPAIALKRIAARVKEGGHNVPAADVRRRFVRSWRNFQEVYRPLSDAWWLYDANVRPPAPITSSHEDARH
jgi:predicted ABC-type ATPase